MYYLMNHTNTDLFADELKAATRAEALAAGISDYLTWPTEERRHSESVSVVECESLDDYFRHGCAWSAEIAGGAILWPSLVNVGRLVQRTHHYAGDCWAVRYNEDWSHDYGTVADGDNGFLRAVKMALGEKHHEIAYVSSDDDYTHDVVDLAPWLE